MVELGERIETIILKDYNGQEIAIEGKTKKIIFFFPKANTSGWITEAAGFQSNIHIYKEADIEIIGISADTPTAQRKFADRLGITYPLLCDEEKRVIKRFGAFGKKKLYGKEYEGIIRSTFILDEDNIVIHVFKKVSPKKHQNEIFQTMNLHG